IGEDVHAQLQRSEGRVGDSRRPIQGGHERGSTLAAQRDAALAILHRFDGVLGWQLALRGGNGAEGVRYDGQGVRHIEFAGDYQHGVIRLIVLVIEGPQLLDVDVLDVRACAYRTL